MGSACCSHDGTAAAAQPDPNHNNQTKGGVNNNHSIKLNGPAAAAAAAADGSPHHTSSGRLVGTTSGATAGGGGGGMTTTTTGTATGIHTPLTTTMTTMNVASGALPNIVSTPPKVLTADGGVSSDGNAPGTGSGSGERPRAERQRSARSLLPGGGGRSPVRDSAPATGDSGAPSALQISLNVNVNAPDAGTASVSQAGASSAPTGGGSIDASGLVISGVPLSRTPTGADGKFPPHLNAPHTPSALAREPSEDGLQNRRPSGPMPGSGATNASTPSPQHQPLQQQFNPSPRASLAGGTPHHRGVSSPSPLTIMPSVGKPATTQSIQSSPGGTSAGGGGGGALAMLWGGSKTAVALSTPSFARSSSEGGLVTSHLGKHAPQQSITTVSTPGGGYGTTAGGAPIHPATTTHAAAVTGASRNVSAQNTPSGSPRPSGVALPPPSPTVGLPPTAAAGTPLASAGGLELLALGRQRTVETAHVNVKEAEDGQEQVNQYLVSNVLLGKGSFGKVKKAYNTQDHQYYAIKIMDKSLLKKRRLMGRGKTTDHWENVKREIAIMKKLDHPNIVRLYEVIDDVADDKLYMVIDFVENGSIMGPEIQAEPLAEPVARKYFRALINGIEYRKRFGSTLCRVPLLTAAVCDLRLVHFQKVMHRDIKPENLLVTANGILKIADFGVSQFFDGDNDRIRNTAGSAAFMAPEMCTGGGEFSGKLTDIWAMGVTLFVFTVGRPPFVCQSLHQIYKAIVETNPDYPKTLNPSLVDLLSKMLDKNPVTRFTLAQIKQHAWVTCDGKEPMLVPGVDDQPHARVLVSSAEVSAALTIKVIFVVKLKGKMHRQTLFARDRLLTRKRSRDFTASGQPIPLDVKSGTNSAGRSPALTPTNGSGSGSGNHSPLPLNVPAFKHSTSTPNASLVPASAPGSTGTSAAPSPAVVIPALPINMTSTPAVQNVAFVPTGRPPSASSAGQHSAHHLHPLQSGRSKPPRESSLSWRSPALDANAAAAAAAATTAAAPSPDPKPASGGGSLLSMLIGQSQSAQAISQAQAHAQSQQPATAHPIEASPRTATRMLNNSQPAGAAVPPPLTAPGSTDAAHPILTVPLQTRSQSANPYAAESNVTHHLPPTSPAPSALSLLLGGGGGGGGHPPPHPNTQQQLSSAAASQQHAANVLGTPIASPGAIVTLLPASPSAHPPQHPHQPYSAYLGNANTAAGMGTNGSSGGRGHASSPSFEVSSNGLVLGANRMAEVGLIMLTAPGMGTGTGTGMGTGNGLESATATLVTPHDTMSTANNGMGTGTGTDGAPITPLAAGFEIATSAAALGAYHHSHHQHPTAVAAAVAAASNTAATTAPQSVDPDSTAIKWGVGDHGTVYYVDGTKQELRLTELSDANHTVGWEVVSSFPELTYSSVQHTVRVHRVSATNTTFIEWESHFSKDASAAVLEDARYKARDAFALLRNEAGKQFTFHSTAEDVVKTANVKGRVFVVTGANSGIGYETVRVLAGAGAKVIFTARDEKKIADTLAALKKGQANADVQGLVCGLDSFKSIRAFAANYAKLNLPLHVLILNAGVMACPAGLTEEKFEMQIGTNHIGHHLLTTLLLPIIKKSAPARIVVLSSAAHRRSDVRFDDMHFTKAGTYDPWLSYGQSKTANILFAKHLNVLLKKEGVAVTANAVHPGGIVTGLMRHCDPEILKKGIPVQVPTPAKPAAAGDAKDSKSDAKAAPATTTTTVMVPFRLKTIPEGAATTLVAALAPTYATVGGLYFSDCNPISPLPYAANMASAERLWKVTEESIAAASK